MVPEARALNPWQGILVGGQPLVHGPDLAAIRAHNMQVSARHEIHLDVYPEPFLGDPSAPILLLNLNPGYGNEAVAAHADPGIADLCVRNLRHEIDGNPYPFYPIHPHYLAHAKSRWWELALTGWIEEYGREVVARAFFCIEYFPYASRYYKRMRRPLASQEYSFELARAKVRSCRLVVAMRHAKQWAAVLGVSGDDWIRRKNPQQKSLNPPGPTRRGNFDAGDADRIRRTIEAHA